MASIFEAFFTLYFDVLTYSGQISDPDKPSTFNYQLSISYFLKFIPSPGNVYSAISFITCK